MLTNFFFPGEFQAFAKKHPEYAKLFCTYRELKSQSEREGGTEVDGGQGQGSSSADKGQKNKDQ